MQGRPTHGDSKAEVARARSTSAGYVNLTRALIEASVWLLAPGTAVPAHACAAASMAIQSPAGLRSAPVRGGMDSVGNRADTAASRGCPDVARHRMTAVAARRPRNAGTHRSEGGLQ